MELVNYIILLLTGIVLSSVSGQESSTTETTSIQTSSATNSTTIISTQASSTTTLATTPFPDDGYNCTENGPFPHPIYCEYYYVCANGDDNLLKCQENYLFDLRYMGCNYPEYTDCGSRTRPDGYPGTITPTSGPTTSPKPGSFICPEQDGNYADPEDCTQFYTCYQEVGTHYQCPFPLYFNPKNEVCDHPGFVDCGDRPIPTASP